MVALWGGDNNLAWFGLLRKYAKFSHHGGSHVNVWMIVHIGNGKSDGCARIRRQHQQCGCDDAILKPIKMDATTMQGICADEGEGDIGRIARYQLTTLMT